MGYDNSFNHWLKRLSNETRQLEVEEAVKRFNFFIVQTTGKKVAVRTFAQADRIARNSLFAIVEEVNHGQNGK